MIPIDTPPQVQDDPALLADMMAGARRADPLYQATNYWAFLEQRFMPELRRLGLKDFRRRHGSVLTSFGATDLRPRTRVRLRLGPLPDRVSRIVDRCVNWLPVVTADTPDFPSDEYTGYFHRVVSRKFADVGQSLAVCPSTRIGNPEDILSIEGGDWTLAHLQICTIFADALRHIPHDPAGVFCELGPGMGRQAEVWARLYPNATILLFDIPPQLYVSHQYLKAVFGDRLLDYRSSILLQPGPDGVLPAEARGKIVMMPSWRFPAWSGCHVDVFWNSASFQEMEPDVAENYLRLALGLSPSWIFLNTIPTGNYWGEWRPGSGGTKLPVTEGILRSVLDEQCSLVAEYDTDYFLQPNNHRSLIFRARA